MSRGSMARRRRDHAPERPEEWPDPMGLVDESDRRAERVEEENARLRERVDEVEAWYRMLQVEHAGLQQRHEQVGRRLAELRADRDRPEPSTPGHEERTDMTHISNWFRGVRQHKWATALAVALATLVARDAGVQEFVSAALARAQRQEGPSDASGSGYLRYATMIQARDEADRARAEYNGLESTLKGDALLEAQDRLRAAKARYRQARLAFLPELARRCEIARLPVPREAADALAVLHRESGE